MIERFGERRDFAMAVVPPRARPPRWLGRRMADADLRGDGNLFTPLRCALAVAVIYTHAVGMTGGTDPLRGVLPFAVSRLAVLLFFTLSGLMVTGSFVRRGAASFVVARALRLLPGLWVMLAVTTLVLGLGFSTAYPVDFFTPANLGDYLGRNLLLIGGGTYRLAGTFAGHVDPAANRSLWSIPQEVHCYLALIVVGLAGLLARRRLMLAGLAAMVAVALTPAAQAFPFVPLAVSFAAGVAMYLWRDRLFLSWPLAIGAVAAALVAPDGALARTAVQLAFGYAVVVAAVLWPAAWKRTAARLPDYSYGIYIYAFPVQQGLLDLGFGTTFASNIVATLAVTVPVAALSWHLIEAPALRLKPRRLAWPRPGAPLAAAWPITRLG